MINLSVPSLTKRCRTATKHEAQMSLGKADHVPTTSEAQRPTFNHGEKAISQR